MTVRTTLTRSISMGALLLLSTSGCGAGGPGMGASTNGPSGALVIEGKDLSLFGGRLIDGLRGRVSSMQVTRPAGGGCPQVLFRGQRTIVGQARPEVYVDGTRMSDTCILEQLRTGDVKRVEIYRGGLTGRAGYAPNPHGIIAVFLLDGLP